MTEYHWSESSALYQAKNGDPADERTASAFSYLEDLTLHGQDTTSLARDLLDAIRELRARELPADVPTGRDESGQPRNWSLTIDHVPGQGWEACFEGGEPTLGTGGFGWEAPSADLVLAYAADALNEQVRPVGPVSVMDFISSLASNALVHEDFGQGSHVFNHVVRDARRIADQLGVTYSPGEDPDEDEGEFA